MHNADVRNGWESLPNGFDVEFRHSIPVRISDNGHGMTVPQEVLLEEVSALGKLHVSLGDWESGERSGEHEASLYVSGQEFSEVLRRLAVSSAALFVERYHKMVDKRDVDWDRLEFFRDFRTALKACGLDRGEVDMQDHFYNYIAAMHEEVERLMLSGESPLVEPE
jgi:hypothetical protein